MKGCALSDHMDNAEGNQMKRTLIGLAASAAVVTLSAGAFASTQLELTNDASTHNIGVIKLAQAGGGDGSGTAKRGMASICHSIFI